MRDLTKADVGNVYKSSDLSLYLFVYDKESDSIKYGTPHSPITGPPDSDHIPKSHEVLLLLDVLDNLYKVLCAGEIYYTSKWNTEKLKKCSI